MGWFELIPGLDIGKEVGCAVLIGICCMLAASSGLGGGPLYLSLLLGFGVEVHDAVPVSKGIIFGGSIIMTFINLFEKDSILDFRKPLIAWDMLNLIEPPAILGAVVGAYVNTALPTWFLLPSEIVLLLYTCVRTTMDAVSVIKKERSERAKAIAKKDSEATSLLIKEEGKENTENNNDNDKTTGVNVKVVELNSNDIDKDIVPLPSELNTEQKNVEELKSNNLEEVEAKLESPQTEKIDLIEQIEDEDEDEDEEKEKIINVKKNKKRCCNVENTRSCYKTFSKIPDESLNDGITTNGLRTMTSHFKYIDPFRISIFLVSFVLVNAFTLARLYFESCSVGYWCFAAAEVVVTIINIVLTIWSFKKSIKSDDPKVHARLLIGSDNNDAYYKPKYYVKNTIVGLLAGVIAAVFGVGGGVLKVPLMRSLGVQPKIARGSSAVMILFTAITSFLAYVALGNIRWQYALPMIFVSIVMFPAGYYLSDLIMHVLKSQSVIPITMGIVMLVSCCLLIPNFVDEIKKIIDNGGKLPGFNPIC